MPSCARLFLKSLALWKSVINCVCIHLQIFSLTGLLAFPVTRRCFSQQVYSELCLKRVILYILELLKSKQAVSLNLSGYTARHNKYFLNLILLLLIQLNSRKTCSKVYNYVLEPCFKRLTQSILTCTVYRPGLPLLKAFHFPLFLKTGFTTLLIFGF